MDLPNGKENTFQNQTLMNLPKKQAIVGTGQKTKKNPPS
jgi:hypothetical protein